MAYKYTPQSGVGLCSRVQRDAVIQIWATERRKTKKKHFTNPCFHWQIDLLPCQWLTDKQPRWPFRGQEKLWGEETVSFFTLHSYAKEMKTSPVSSGLEASDILFVCLLVVGLPDFKRTCLILCSISELLHLCHMDVSATLCCGRFGLAQRLKSPFRGAGQH